MSTNPSSDAGRTGPPDPSGNDILVGNVTAVIGDIIPKSKFSDPEVSVTHKRETADHEKVSGHAGGGSSGRDYTVQALGRRPPEVEVVAWLTEDQVTVADTLVSEHTIPLITGRYIGTVVPKRVDIPYSRVADPDHGWIFEVTFEFLGVTEEL